MYKLSDVDALYSDLMVAISCYVVVSSEQRRMRMKRRMMM
jgi:hypothetical protein